MKEVAIKDICHKDSSALKQKELLSEGKYPVFGASGIAGYLNTFYQEKEYIGIVKDGSGIGRVAFYPAESSLIGTMQYILPKEDYDIRYIGYCLQSLDLSKYKQGAAIPHIYFRDYGERFVKVTDNKEEQRSIVARLDAAFSHIDALKANAEKQLNEARKLFQAELTECMKPKEGWEEKKLGEVCEILNGFAFQSKNYVPEGIRVIRITNVQKGYIEDTDPKYYPYETQDELSRYLLNDGDMLLSLTGNVGRVAIIDKHYLPAYLNQRVACIRVKNGNCLDLNYLFHLLYSKKFEEDCINSARGAAQKNMSTVWLASYPILVPPLFEQHSIVSHLDSLSSTIRKLEELQQKTLAECDALKQAMLREVFE